MNRSFPWTGLYGGALFCAALLVSTAAFPQAIDIPEQSADPVISLVSETPNAISAATPVKGEASFANAPANFHRFASARVGEDSYPEQLTLRFAVSTTLTGINSSKDFTIESGGTCNVHAFYSAGSSCSLMVRFTPQGAGPRLGKLTITNTASAQPAAIGLGGSGFAPVVSFTPAIITTVPGTGAGPGLLNAAQNLAVDGGDSLYIADTGNNLIRYLDSSGNFKTLATGTAPVGVAVDSFGQVYFDLPAANKMYEIYDYGPVVQVSGSGSNTCTAATPCSLSAQALGTPGTMSIDPYNRLFFVDSHAGAAMATVQPIPAKLVFLYDPFPYQTNPSSPIVADSFDNIYSLWSNGGVCEIVRATLFDAENSNVIFTKIAGGHTCGFSGDGAEAGNAEIGAKVGQMAFDVAGNLYFTDTVNNRLRRVDEVTGIISTLAGTGPGGNGGDGGPSTSANLNSPTGVGVDSQGQVYVISTTYPGPTQQIRKLGPNGYLNFNGSQPAGTTSAPAIVTVANTGNSTLTLTNAVITGANPGDFAIDKNTTSCNLAAGASLFSGESCKVGVVFTPSATGTRTANFQLLDNTVTNTNTVQLAGTGAPAPAAATPAVKLSSSVNPAKNCKSVVFSITVDGASGAMPTGTVVLQEGSTVLATAALNHGEAKMPATALKKGRNVLNASYQGNAVYSAATSPTLTQMVSQACKQTKKLKARR